MMRMPLRDPFFGMKERDGVSERKRGRIKEFNIILLMRWEGAHTILRAGIRERNWPISMR